jgi:hypothetical protein
MNCSDFELIIRRVAGKQALEDPGQEVLAHTDVCRHCAIRLAEEQALVAGVRAVVADLANHQAPALVEEALLTAFRQQRVAKRSGVVLPAPAGKRRRTEWKPAAAAALIVIVASAIALLRSQPYELSQRGQKSTTSNESAARQQPGQDRAEAAADPLLLIAADQRLRHKPIPHRARKARTRYEETTTDYFALTDEEDLRSLDSAQVVRVELPASALIAVGLGAEPRSEVETVKADILLGQDGLARAIRFVR